MILLSDVRISVETPNGWIEVPSIGVKKIHHVAPTVFVGFAGSIVAGFRLVDDLDLFLGGAYDPSRPVHDMVGDWLANLPERCSTLIPPEVAASGTDLVIVGMHLAPVMDGDGKDTGTRDPFGSGVVTRFDAPGSGLATVDRFGWSRAVSIGSGAGVPEYQQMLQELDWIGLSQWPSPAEVLTAIMNMTIVTTPTPGISPDLVALLMKRVPGNIEGSGLVHGPLASDRTRIAETEEELADLWSSVQAPLSRARA